jgi:hypothetical protein
MYRIFQFRGENAVREFDEEVERQKLLLIKEDKLQQNLNRMREEKTIRQIEDRIDERAIYNTSPNNRKKLRQMEKKDSEKRRRDAYLSEEDKKAELELAIQRRSTRKALGEAEINPALVRPDGEVLWATPAAVVRQMPSMRLQLTLASAGATRAELGRYVLEHSASTPPS